MGSQQSQYPQQGYYQQPPGYQHGGYQQGYGGQPQMGYYQQQQPVYYQQRRSDQGCCTACLASLLCCCALDECMDCLSAPTANSPCFYPSANTVCGAAFAGYPIFVVGKNGTNVVDSDARLNALASAWSAPADIARTVQNPDPTKATGCSANNALVVDAAKAVRYQASVWCSAVVAQTLLTTTCLAKVPTQPGQTNPAVLCEEQCKIASDTMQAMWNNATVCPKASTAQDEIRASYLAIYKTFNLPKFPSYCDYANFAIQEGKAVCYDGIPDGAGGAFCGYATAALAQSQCSTNTADPCCSALLESIQTGKPFVKPSTISTDSGDKSRNIIIIVGIVIVTLIGAGILAYVCFRSRERRRRTKADKFRKNSSNKNAFYRFSNEHQSPVPPVPPLPQNLRNAKEKGPETNNSSYHREQQSPDFHDGWTPRTNEQHHVQEPKNAYRGDIPLSPMPSPTRSHPQAGYANDNFQNQQPIGYDQAGPSQKSAAPPVSMAAVPRDRNPWDAPQKSVAPPVAMAAGPRGDVSASQPGRSPWDAPVVTAQPVPPPSVSSDATPPSEDGSDILNIPMRVLHHYVPTLTDELPLQAGTEIIMVKCFDDGWALGVNPSTGQTGAFPLVCVAASESVERNVPPVARAAAERARSPVLDRVSDMTFAKRVSSQQYLSRVDLSQLAAITTADGMHRSLGEVRPSPAEKTSALLQALDNSIPRESFGTMPAQSQSAAPASMLAFPEPPSIQPFVVGSDHEDDFNQPPNERREIVEPVQPQPAAPARSAIPPPRITVPPVAGSELAAAAAPAGPFDDHHRIDHAEPPAGPAPTLPELSLGSIGFDLGAVPAEESRFSSTPSGADDRDADVNPFKNTQ
ncbi:hypothetical protein HDU86_000701 [Geranomyces michiganensis]|nr:hypothetical protein HDU86_000701 [Geranomyces michiganensis]